jgi:DNA transformation protein and related proteins
MTLSLHVLIRSIALYRNGQFFAMAWKGILYFKVDEATRKDCEAANSHALGYLSEGVDHSLKSFWEVPADVIEGRDCEAATQSPKR